MKKTFCKKHPTDQVLPDENNCCSLCGSGMDAEGNCTFSHGDISKSAQILQYSLETIENELVALDDNIAVELIVRLPINDDVPRDFVKTDSQSNSTRYQKVVDAIGGEVKKVITLCIPD